MIMRKKPLAFVSLIIVFLFLLLILFANKVFLMLNSRVYIEDAPKVSQAAQSLHQNLLIADLHVDSTMQNRNLLHKSKYGHVDIPRMQLGNVAIGVFTVATRFNLTRDLHHMPSDSFDLLTLLFMRNWPKPTWFNLMERASHQAQLVHQAVETSEDFSLITNKRNLLSFLYNRSTDPKQTASLLAIEGLHPLGNNINHLDVLYQQGFRILAPVHFFDNDLGGSANGENKKGLTDFGHDVLIKMDNMGFILDLAHASEKLIEDSVNTFNGGILVSHTGVKGVCDRLRNISDQHIKMIARKGGIIGIGFFELALCGTDMASLIKSIQYVVDLVGIDHVALGSDYDGMVKAIFKINDINLVTEALLSHGFSKEEISKIMGGNVLRFLNKHLPSH